MAQRLALALVLVFLGSSLAQASLDTAWTHVLYDQNDLEKGVKEFGQPAFARQGKLLLAGGRDGQLWAFDVASQSVLWKRNLTDRVIAQPAILADDRAIIADTGGQIRMINLDTGEDVWNSTIQTQGSFHGRIMVHGPIFSALDSANRLVAATLTGRFLFDIGQREVQGFQLYGESTPVTDSKAIFVGFSNGSVASIHPITGTINWETELPNQGGKINDIQAGPVIVSGHLLVGGPGTGLHVLDRASGEKKETLKLPGVVSLLPASDSSVYALTWKGTVAEIEVADTGKLSIRWSNTFPGVPSPAALTDKSILFCNGKGLLSLSRADGSVQSYRTFAEGCASGVATAKGLAATISANGELVVWRVSRP